MKLISYACKNAKPGEKSYTLADGSGMFLKVIPHGSKLWRQEYQINHKEKLISLGSHPETSLRENYVLADIPHLLFMTKPLPSGLELQTRSEISAVSRNLQCQNKL